MLAVKLPGLPTRSRQKTGKISFKVQFRIQMWKIIQGLNGITDVNSSNEAMSHNGRIITDNKSKANVFINYYARVSKLNELIKISTVNSKNYSTHHLLTMKAVLHFKWLSYYLPSKRWSRKEQLALATFQLQFSSHSAFWSSWSYYLHSTHLFLLLLVHASRGFSSLFH